MQNHYRMTLQSSLKAVRWLRLIQVVSVLLMSISGCTMLIKPILIYDETVEFDGIMVEVEYVV